MKWRMLFVVIVSLFIIFSNGESERIPACDAGTYGIARNGESYFVQTTRITSTDELGNVTIICESK